MTCDRNQIQFQGVGCIQCHEGCSGCTRPLDSAACLGCAQGYTLVQGKCQICEANCLTCSQFTTSCTSCKYRSELLLAGKCVHSCTDPGFFMDPFKLTCLQCSSSCLDCTTATTCSSCPVSYYLTAQGSCGACNQNCINCWTSPHLCIQCASNFIKNAADNTCTMNCVGAVVNIYQNGPICMPCHPACLTCQDHPQNCTSCLNKTSYLDSSLGLYVCAQCQPPCVACSSLKSCTSCVDGYYL